MRWDEAEGKSREADRGLSFLCLFCQLISGRLVSVELFYGAVIKRAHVAVNGLAIMTSANHVHLITVTALQDLKSLDDGPYLYVPTATLSLTETEITVNLLKFMSFRLVNYATLNRTTTLFKIYY